MAEIQFSWDKCCIFDMKDNLNIEVGVTANHAELANAVKCKIDMSEGSSWNVKEDGRDNATTFLKRGKLFFWKLIPIKSI